MGVGWGCLQQCQKGGIVDGGGVGMSAAMPERWDHGGGGGGDVHSDARWDHGCGWMGWGVHSDATKVGSWMGGGGLKHAGGKRTNRV